MFANGFGLGEGGEIEAKKLNLLLMFNQGTNVEFCTKSPLLQNRCYLPFFINYGTNLKDLGNSLFYSF